MMIMDLTTQKTQRQDTIRNKKALLAAVGDLLYSGANQITMPDVAEQAQLAVSTAYRYFPTLEDLYREYICSVVEPLAKHSKTTKAHDGQQLFSDVLGKWIELVERHGSVLTRVRSREGFLGRFEQGDHLTQLLAECWGKPVRTLMSELSVPQDQFPAALALCNALINSGQIMDLSQHLGLATPNLIRRVTSMYRGALAALGTDSQG